MHVAVQLHLIVASESRVRDEVAESVVCLEKLSCSKSVFDLPTPIASRNGSINFNPSVYFYLFSIGTTRNHQRTVNMNMLNRLRSFHVVNYAFALNTRE